MFDNCNEQERSKTVNLHWPVYKNLEQEIIELSFNVFFDDSQFEYILDIKDGTKYIKTPPYSLKISDLLVRCCTEIEAIILEMTQGYDEEIKKLPTFDKKRGITIACRAVYLNGQIDLDKKIVYVSFPNMFFRNEENQAFAPFCYGREDNDDFIAAYNTVKHNRNIDTIYKGNIRFLLRAMAALYLLNIYYKNEVMIKLGCLVTKGEFDNRLSSDIFSVKCAEALSLTWDDNMSDESILWKKGDSRQESTYIIKFVDRSFKALHKAHCLDHIKTQKQIMESQLVMDFLKNNPDKKFNNTNDLLRQAGGVELVTQLASHEFGNVITNAKTEAVLNKNQAIYPCVSYKNDD